MHKTTYGTKTDAAEMAWQMTQVSKAPVWIYPFEGGWQVTGQCHLLTTPPIMPALPLLSESTRTLPKFDREHPAREVYRVAFNGYSFTQMNQLIQDNKVSKALANGAAVIISQPRFMRDADAEIIRRMKALLPSYFFAIRTCGYRHYIVIASKHKNRALADVYDTIVLHQVLSTPSKLFTGVIPYGDDARIES